MATYRGTQRAGKPPAGPAEKPYKLLPLFAPTPRRAAPPGHGLLAQTETNPTLAGVISFSLTTLTPLHVALGIVGTTRFGGKEEFGALPVVTRRYTSGADSSTVRKIPVLPGSSLRGALRSLVEALSPSCIPVVSSALRNELDDSHPFQRCSGAKSLCPACRLFGNTQYASHVAVSDLRFSPADLRWHRSPLLWKPGQGSSLRLRYTHNRRPAGRKVYHHRAPATGTDLRVVIRQEATVDGTISFTGVQAADLGLLLVAMGVHPDHPFPIKIGGGKPVGLGSVLIRVRSVVVYDGANVGQALRKTGRLGTSYASSTSSDAASTNTAGPLTSEALDAWIRRQVQAALETGVLLDEAFQRLRSVLDPDGLMKPAPDQFY